MFESEMFCTRGVPIKATVYSQKEPSLCIIPFKYMYVYVLNLPFLELVCFAVAVLPGL